MTLRYRKIGFAACLLVGSALTASAQAVNTATVSVKDIDQEARNAYQEGCRVSTTATVGSCVLPALPDGKRLAIRWLSAICSASASRITGIQMFHELSGSALFCSPGNGCTLTRFRGPSTVFDNSGHRILEEPVYAHADVTPVIEVFLNDTKVLTECIFSVKGYLVNK